MQIIGHRGAAGLAPENTRASFRAALIAGVDGIEFNVRATRDGRIVVVHDHHTWRVARKPHFISRTLYSAIKKLRLQHGHTIPTLAEALNVIDGQAMVVIHIKSRGCAKTVVSHIRRLVKNGARYSQFMVVSASAERLREVAWLSGHIPLTLLQRYRPYRFMKVKGLRLKGVGFYHKVMPARAVKEAHLYGLDVFAYVVNSPMRAHVLQAKGVDGLFTGRPDLMQELRAKRGD